MENVNEENTDDKIKEILRRQQVLESLKANCHSAALSSDAYAQKITARCGRESGSAARTRNALTILLLVVILLSALMFFLFMLAGLLLLSDPPVTGGITADYPLGRAKTAMQDGNYDTAHAILSEELDKNPKSAFALSTYAELCQLEGRHDEAAQTLIDYLDNISGTQNIQDGNLLYIQLEELTDPLSPDVEKARQKCLASCRESIENFNFLNTLIENGKYQMALNFCDSMRQQNVTDYNLYTYYFTCYTQLEKYEECAAYFLSLSDEWQTEGDIFTFRLPLKFTIRDKLNELKPYVSEATQQKIDDACLLLDRS